MPSRLLRAILLGVLGLSVLTLGPQSHSLSAAGRQNPPPASAARRDLLNTYCIACHNARLKTAGLVLESIDTEQVAANAELWEKVLRKVGSGQMPPPARTRPDKETTRRFCDELARALDDAAGAAPNPGRPAVHRLNRSEYVSAIRDLLNLEIDGQALLPADDSGYGFDNNADVLTLPPALLERYMTAAAKITRLAIGDPGIRPVIERYQVSRLLRQDERMSEALPFGTRGGVAIRHTFPLDGEYAIRVRMKRTDVIVGLDKGDQIEVRLDGVRVALFTLGGLEEMKGITYTTNVSLPKDRPDILKRYLYDTTADDGLEVHFAAKAGTRVVGVAFLRDSSVEEGSIGGTGEGRSRGRPNSPAVDYVQVSGPYDGRVPDGTPSQQRIFICRPASTADELSCATRILVALARRALRRPVTGADVQPLLEFYAEGRRDGTFDRGIQAGLERLLVDPEFLFRLERDPEGLPPGTVYQLSGPELASRLSFFLWGTIPDEGLLAMAERRALNGADALSRQAARMLADSRASAMVKNFASQWLLVRNVRLHTPDVAMFPNFDDNLKEAFARETELFFESQFREDRSILEMLSADYTFVNNRLADLYGIPDVHGSHFRRVKLADEKRHGLLGHGSILTVTSYPDRTSPVLRGKWVLENLLGAPPPPPPPNVPALKESAQGKPTTVRERLEQHRASPTCASCHARMDPLGFALENFDPIGQWRDADNGAPIDAASVLPDGSKVDGPVAFRQALLARREEFATNFTEKLMTYALGRGLEFYDAPAVRRIVKDAAAHDYRWSDIVLGIVKSVPFRMRRTPQP